jgi:hypothetical protein
VYTCDSNSTVKQISFSTTRIAKVTCNGIVVTTKDDVYDFVYAEPSYPKPYPHPPYGEPQYGQPPYGEPSYSPPPPETVAITNYTQIYEYNMGWYII